MKRINGRYELQETIGSGGMGVVYKAYDAVVKRPVALKTIRDSTVGAALELFRKECSILAAVSHPNIVEIFDIGEFEEAGSKKPYFVMPLLPGDTLDKCSLSIEQICDIILQTCRGLQAAHDRGLIHRDLKPTNIFVLPDQSVKIIDFGVAHMTDSRASMTIKGGTLPYMSPEQLNSDVAPTSDLFSLGVVFYEAVTRRHPFRFLTEEQTIRAIRFLTPPPAWDLNREVGQTVSRIIHKCMAKQPHNRFPSARELAETIVKARRNDPIPMFDASHIQPRINHATKAFEDGHYEFAADIISKLEAEGHADPAISNLRKQIDDAVRKKRIHQLIDSARKCFDADEYALAQEKLDQVFRIEPSNTAALMMQASVQNRISEQKVDDWIRVARQHLDNNAFAHARDALRNLLQVRPKETTAVQLLAEVDRRELQFKKAREDKSRLYQAAIQARQNGEMSAALTNMERLIALDGEIPDTSDPERAMEHQRFFEQVRAEHDSVQTAYKEARRNLSENNFAAALAICDDFLAKYPGHALFQALKIDVHDRQRQELSARIAETDRCVEAEADLDRRVAILKEASKEYPDEPHFERALRLTRDKRDLVSGIVAKARSYEDNGQFNEALERWETLRTIHQQYPGLDFEIERLKKRRDQQARAEAKAKWVNHVDSLLESGAYERAIAVLEDAAGEFPADEELLALQSIARQALERTAKAADLLKEGERLYAAGDIVSGVECLRQAHELDERNPSIRTAYIDTLLKEAAAQLNSNWDTAEHLSKQALQVDPGHPLARSLYMQALDRKREAFINKAVAEARRMQADGDVAGAIARVEEALATYPQDQRLLQVRVTLRKFAPETLSRAAAATAERQQEKPPGLTELDQRLAQPDTGRSAAARNARLEELERLFATSAASSDAVSMNTLKAQAERYAALYPDDDRFRVFHTRVCEAATRLFEHQPPNPTGDPGQPPPERPSVQPAREPLTTRVQKAIAAQLNARRGWLTTLNGRFGRRVLLAGVGVVSAVVVFLLTVVPMLPVPVEIRTSPEGAIVSVDGSPVVLSQSGIRLRPGAHRLKGVKDGYNPVESTIHVDRSANNVFHLTLAPIHVRPLDPAPVRLPALQLGSDLSAGRVTIDKTLTTELQNGQFALPELARGPHVIEISGGRSSGQIAIETDADGFARILSVQGSNLAIVAISSWKNEVRIHANSEPLPAWLNDKMVSGKLGAAPIAVTEVAEGNHSLRFGTGSRERTVAFSVGPSPVLVLSATSDRDVGTLIVRAGQPDATVFIDGMEVKQKTNAAGDFRLPNVPVGSYTVRVQKEGFYAQQHETSVLKGRDATLQAMLKPLPAMLEIANALPGARVLLDDNDIGQIGSSGTFTASSITPGPHTVKLQHDEDYESDVDTHTYKPGEKHAWQVSLRQVRFPVTIKVTPPSAKVEADISGTRVELKSGQKLRSGRYTTVVSAAGCKPNDIALEVGPDKPNQIVSTLMCAQAQAAPKPPAMGDEWLKSWRAEGAWYAPPRGTAWCPGTPSVVQFTALLQGNKRAAWYVDYQGNNNFVLFELSKDKLRRTVMFNNRKNASAGDKRQQESIPEPLRAGGENGSTIYQVRIRILPNEIEHQVLVNGDWKTIDKWLVTSRNLSAGRFGFHQDTRLSHLQVR
jgi:serine/threonine-protein kinase